MFVKPFPKYDSTTKKRYTIYRLCKSDRLDGRIRHRTIIGLGKLDELKDDTQIKLLGKHIEEMLKYGSGLLMQEAISEQINYLSLQFYRQIFKKQRYDVKGKILIGK